MTETTNPTAPAAGSKALAWVVIAVLLGGVAFAVSRFAGKEDAPATADDATSLDQHEEVAGHLVDPSGADRPGEGRPLTADSGLLATSPGRLPDHACVERSGKEMTTHDLLGRFVVVDFIFTSCSGTCIPMAKHMHDLQESTKDADDLLLVSFTTDPRRDSPERLAEYAQEVGAEADRWWFLFTQKALVHHIAYEGMRLGSATNPMLHSQKFVLLDRAGNVRAYYDPLEDEGWKAKLLRDLDTLRAEPN